MSYIINFLKDFASIFMSLIDFIVLLFRDLLQLLLLLPKAVTYIMTAVTHLPPMVLPFATITIAIAILFLVLGRGSSGGADN